MKRGQQNPGKMRRDTVDYRFALAVENALATEFAPPGVRLTTGDMATGLSVSRTTIYCWQSGIHGISRAAVQPFLDCDDWRGIFSRRVWQIHEDHLRWRMEANKKRTRAWIRGRSFAG